MKADTTGDFCPLLQKPCIERECAWYAKVQGKHPQSEQVLDHWGCSIPWLTVLLVENSQMQRQTGAAVESFRNEVIRAKRDDQILDAAYLLGNVDMSPRRTSPHIGNSGSTNTELLGKPDA